MTAEKGGTLPGNSHGGKAAVAMAETAHKPAQIISKKSVNTCAGRTTSLFEVLAGFWGLFF